MILLPVNASPELGAYRRSPVLIFLGALLLFHIFAFVPQLKAEARVAAMGREFREHWETGYARHLAEQGKAVDAKAYRSELNKYLQTYTGKKLLYWIQVVPDRFSPLSAFTSWMVQPGWRGWFSILPFILVAFPLGVFFSDRWGATKTLGVFILGSTVGALSYLFITVFWIGRGGTLPFSGTTHGTAVLMGAFLRFHGKLPLRLLMRSGGRWKSIKVRFALFMGLWLTWEFLLGWFIFPSNYGRSFLLALPLLGLGWWLGHAVPARKVRMSEILQERAKVVRQVDPAVELRERSAQKVHQGWALFDGMDFDAAAESLRTGLEGLFRDAENNRDLISATFERLLAEKLQLRIEPQTWLEWGHSLAAMGLSRSAILCLERAVRSGLSALASRNALTVVAEHRIKEGWEIEKARTYLQKVIQHNPDDLSGRRAQGLLNTLPPQ